MSTRGVPAPAPNFAHLSDGALKKLHAMVGPVGQEKIERYRTRRPKTNRTGEQGAGEVPQGCRSAKGKRPDLGGVYFRSRWEANVARVLNWLQQNGALWKWDYEQEEFEFPVKRGSRFYKVDFRLWWTEDSERIVWEVKGYMDSKSKTKLKRMRLYYPGVTVEVIDADRYREIARQYSGFIPNWESGT